MSQQLTRHRALAIVLACLCLAGCKDRHEPVKPTTLVATAAAVPG